MFKRVMKEMEDLVSHIMTTFEEPLEEDEVAKIALFFKIALNNRSGNLTDEEAEIALRNINRTDSWLEGTLTSEYQDGTTCSDLLLFDPKTKVIQCHKDHVFWKKPLTDKYLDVVINGTLHRKPLLGAPPSYPRKIIPQEELSKQVQTIEESNRVRVTMKQESRICRACIAESCIGCSYPVKSGLIDLVEDNTDDNL